MDYFINNALCLKAKKKKFFFLTIQYFRKSLKPVARAKRLIFYYLSEVQHESPAAQQREGFGPLQLAAPTSTRGAQTISTRCCQVQKRCWGRLIGALRSCCCQTMGAVCSTEEHTSRAQGTTSATQSRWPHCGEAEVYMELGLGQRGR